MPRQRRFYDIMYNVNKNLIHIENPKHLERKGFYTLTTIHNLDHGIRESKTARIVFATTG